MQRRAASGEAAEPRAWVLRRVWAASVAFLMALAWNGIVDHPAGGSQTVSASRAVVAAAPLAVALAFLLVLGVSGRRSARDHRTRGALDLLVLASLSLLVAVVWAVLDRGRSPDDDPRSGLVVTGMVALIVSVVWLVVVRRRGDRTGPDRPTVLGNRIERWGPLGYLLVFGTLSLSALAVLVMPSRLPNLVAGLVATVAVLGWVAARGFAIVERRLPPGAAQPADAASGAGSAAGRLTRSWRLTTIAWRLLRADRTSLVLTGLSVAASAAGTFVLFWASGWLVDPHWSGRLVGVSLLMAWPLTFVGTYLGVALVAAAAAALDGGRMSLRTALAVPTGRVGQIAIWSLLAAGVGVVLRQVAERLPFGGRVATWALGAAWGLVTLLAVPILALEGCAATACVSRSASLMRERWGEGITGTVAISAWAVAACLPAGAAIGVGTALTGDLRLVVTAVAVLVLIVVGSVTGATRLVFAVALYRYASDQTVQGGYDRDDLDRPFTPRRGWLRPV